MGSKTKGHKAKTKNKNKPDSVHSNNNQESGGGKIIKDARFASLHSDPRFQKVPKRKTKVVIDSRFNRMFTDKRFASSSAPLDKRGKPKKGNTQGSLRHYYHLEEEEGEEEKRKKAALSEEDGTEEESDTSESDTSEMPQMDSDGELEEEEISESGSTTEEEDIDIDYEDREPEIQRWQKMPVVVLITLVTVEMVILKQDPAVVRSLSCLVLSLALVRTMATSSKVALKAMKA